MDEILLQLPLREPTFFILLSLSPGPKHGYAILKEVEILSEGLVMLSTSTLVNMAIGYYETGQSAKAAAAAQQVLRYDDTSAPAYTVLGAVELEARQFRLALAHLSRAVALDGSYSQAHFYLGLAYRVLDQPVEAIAALEQALATAEDEEMRSEIRRHLADLDETGK